MECSKTDRLIALGATNGWFKFTSLECQLKSGRKFRYQMSDYPFRVDTTRDEAEQLAWKIVGDKYRNCPWDEAHPETNQEIEIANFIRDWILSKVAAAERVRQARLAKENTKATE
jgi:hypothetical protein